MAIPLAGFHKVKGRKDENEVRLLVFNKASLLENQHFPLDFIDYEIDNEIRLIEKESKDLDYYIFVTEARKKYIELKLNPTNKADYKNLRPIPKIERIILGPKLYEIAKLRKEFKEKARKGLGYEIEVETSKIDLSNIRN